MAAVMKANPRICDICEAPSKYCCPKCYVRTCSLKCVRLHKSSTRCDGIRDKTAYVQLDKFTDLDLLSDYRFLEEAGRVADNAMRNKLIRCGGGSTGGRRRRMLPYPVHRLQVEAHLRGTILRFLPPTFQKRRKNASHFRQRDRTIIWQIEWVFPLAEGMQYVDKRVSEDTVVADALQKYFDPANLSPDVQQKLASYLGAGINNVHVLMKAVNKPANSPQYYKFDLYASLRENLSGKTLIEYPTLYVVPKHHMDCYPVIDSSEDEDDEKINNDSTEEPLNEDESMEMDALTEQHTDCPSVVDNDDADNSNKANEDSKETKQTDAATEQHSECSTIINNDDTNNINSNEQPSDNAELKPVNMDSYLVSNNDDKEQPSHDAESKQVIQQNDTVQESKAESITMV